MPTPLPAGPWIRFVQYYGGLSKFWQNEWWFKVTSSVPPTTSVASVGAALYAAISPPVSNIMNQEYSILGWRVYLNNGVYTASYDANSIVSGTLVSDSLPVEITAIVTGNAGVATRAGVGRTFLSGLDSSLLDNGRLTNAAVTLLDAINTALKGIVAPGGVSAAYAIWSRKLGSLDIVAFTAETAVTGAIRKRRPRF
jgi:hypothetical protein